MAANNMAPTRSQAENLIRLGKVKVDGKLVTKPGFFIKPESKIKVEAGEQYVSRAGLKLASVVDALYVTFTDKIVLDVGSSTGGFTDYALQHGAKQVIAVDVGTEQMHPSLRDNPQIELHEKTDIRDFRTKHKIDLVLCDVSFISVRDVLPAVLRLVAPKTELLIMVKPQFEAGKSNMKHNGIVKNAHMRRDILKDFEFWAKDYFSIVSKVDSSVPGAKGNLERFYKLRVISKPAS